MDTLKNKKVLILGTGGTSKTAFVLSKDLGCAQVIKVSRRKSDETISYEEDGSKFVWEYDENETLIKETHYDTKGDIIG